MSHRFHLNYFELNLLLQQQQRQPSYSNFEVDYTKKIFVPIQQRTKPFFLHPTIMRPDGLENSPLAKLPIELLQQVANDLPLASAVSSSLSCRYVYFMIGTQYLEHLATADHEKLVFLKLIEHDLQNQIACNPCKILHKNQNARKYIQSGRHNWRLAEPKCFLDDRMARVALYIHENFSTTLFKMVMKHHHHFGYDSRCHELFDRLSEEITPISWFWGIFLQRQKAEY